MTDLAALATALVLGDSAFPSGGFTASWGLEGLHADGLVTDAATFEAFVVGQMHHRWATFDRVLSHRAVRAAGNIAELIEIDRLTDAMTLAPAARAASSRAGRAALTTYAQLASPLATAYRAVVRRDDAPGHLAVVQPALWAESGLDAATIEVISGLQYARQLASAAVRLGIVGHLDGQRTITVARDHLLTIVAEPCPTEPSTATPLTDIALLRHPTRSYRLFAC